MIEIPIGVLLWYPQHRVLASEWDSIRPYTHGSMVPTLAIKGHRHTIIFQFNDELQLKSDGRGEGFRAVDAPQGYDDIVLWHFPYGYNARAIIKEWFGP
jgi:hypothetical protein